MTELNAKQEAIKKAYGELFDKYKDRIDNDGFIHYKSEKVRKEIASLLGEIESSYNYSIFRPKSLQGIENNNGWVKIESEADLPKNKNVWICTNNNRILISSKAVLNWVLKNPDNKITHYQPIEKPKLPIY